jgi:hypothetical protein
MTTDEAKVPKLITPIMPKMNHPINGMKVDVVGIWSLTLIRRIGQLIWFKIGTCHQH